jgi:hypothetical protein
VRSVLGGIDELRTAATFDDGAFLAVTSGGGGFDFRVPKGGTWGGGMTGWISRGSVPAGSDGWGRPLERIGAEGFAAGLEARVAAPGLAVVGAIF